MYLVHTIFTAGLLYELPFAFSGFPLLSCLSKIYQRNSRNSKHPTKLEILNTYLSTLTNDTVTISITQIHEKLRGPCMAVLYSTDQCLHVLYVGFFYELTRFEPLDEAPGHVRVALGQTIRFDYTLNTVIGLSSSAFEIKITD